MIGAYFDSGHFAYPGWRLTVPGGPAGGHYKGFTHTESTGTDIPPQDSYEQDREDGMSSHDCAHATPQQPRGVYRSSAEVPPRPNASGSAHTYRSFQTKRHAGTSVAPGSFPGLVENTNEDDFLGAIPAMMDRMDPAFRPNAVQYFAPPPTIHVPPIQYFKEPTSGATSVVRQSPPTALPAPPSPAVQVVSAPPISPQPAPVVATNEVVPTSDGSLVNTSTGQIVSASQVTQNPATGQLTASGALSSAENWLEQPSSIFPSIPNWGLLLAGAGLLLVMGKSAHR